MYSHNNYSHILNTIRRFYTMDKVRKVNIRGVLKTESAKVTKETKICNRTINLMHKALQHSCEKINEALLKQIETIEKNTKINIEKSNKKIALLQEDIDGTTKKSERTQIITSIEQENQAELIKFRNAHTKKTQRELAETKKSLNDDYTKSIKSIKQDLKSIKQTRRKKVGTEVLAKGLKLSFQAVSGVKKLLTGKPISTIPKILKEPPPFQWQK